MVQKKKSDEQDVLVVRDEKTGEISVVAGLSRDGTPKRAPAKAENTPDFLRFDRNSDLMDSFFRNFYRQCKEPSRFGFYRIAADQVENLLGVMKELLKDPEANKEKMCIRDSGVKAGDRVAGLGNSEGSQKALNMLCLLYTSTYYTEEDVMQFVENNVKEFKKENVEHYMTRIHQKIK